MVQGPTCSLWLLSSPRSGLPGDILKHDFIQNPRCLGNSSKLSHPSTRCQATFLHGDLTEYIYMHQPPHYKPASTPMKVCKLHTFILDIKFLKSIKIFKYQIFLKKGMQSNNVFFHRKVISNLPVAQATDACLTNLTLSQKNKIAQDN